jgi:hypothetical protein
MYPAEKLFSNDASTEEFSIAAAHVDAGRLDEHFYDNTLSWWRLAIRRVLVDQVEKESDVIAAMQVCMSSTRCPLILDECRIGFVLHGWTPSLCTLHPSEPTPSSSPHSQCFFSLVIMIWVVGTPFVALIFCIQYLPTSQLTFNSSIWGLHFFFDQRPVLFSSTVYAAGSPIK